MSNAKTDPGARKEHAAYCSHLRDPEMEGCDCDEPEIRPFAERCGLPGTAPAPPPERTLTGVWVWRDLGYEGPLSHQQVVEALRQIDDYTPQAVAVEITDAALRERLVRAEAAVQDHNLLCERNDKAVRARWFEEKARADKAAADLATAMAALREIADFAHCDAEGFIVQPCPCPLCALSLRIAREALARIEEKK